MTAVDRLVTGVDERSPPVRRRRRWYRSGGEAHAPAEAGTGQGWLGVDPWDVRVAICGANRPTLVALGHGWATTRAEKCATASRTKRMLYPL